MYSKDKNENTELYPDNPLVCICFRVKESDIEMALNSGKAMCVDDISDLTNAGIGCRGCICNIEKLLNNFVFGPENPRLFEDFRGNIFAQVESSGDQQSHL